MDWRQREAKRFQRFESRLCEFEAIVGALASAAVSSLFGGGGDSSSAGVTADNAAGAAALKQAQIAGEQWDFYKANFQPLEKDLVDKAAKFGSPEEQERAAGEASTTVTAAAGKAKAAFDRNIASYGINPASGKFNDANLRMGLDTAKADAGAQNLARKGVRDLAFGKTLDVIGIGKGLPATATAGLANAANANAAIGTNQFLRGQYLDQQAQRAAAPFVNLAQTGVKRWFGGGGMPDGNWGSSGGTDWSTGEQWPDLLNG